MALRTICPARLLAILLSIVLFADAGAPAAAPQGAIAYLAVDLKTNSAVETVRPDLLDIPIRPGSVAKIATLAAALESGIITDRTGIVCSRDVDIAGHHLVCTHPDLHRPLRPAEALAHSCNVYFATIAARLPRSSLDRALMSLGLPPSDPGQPVAAAALGVEGIRASPRQLVAMIARVAAVPTALPWRAGTLSVVREGLRGAATVGTALALAEQGVDAMAKTGTTVINGVSQGLVVGVTPASNPVTAFVLLASSASGMDAAALAAERLRPPQTPSAATVRIGVAGDSGYTVRTMPLETYVAGVVAGEAAGSTPAALEALAITVRTFAMANLGRHRAEGFDLCDLTHCQVLRDPNASTTRAARTTTGQVLLYKGAPASVFYTASCGGHSERPSAVWPGAPDPPFLPSRPDAACQGEPAWSSDIPVADLMRALRAGGFKGDVLRDISVVSRTASHRVAWLRLDGLTPHEISGDDLRTLVGRTLGWQHVRSTAFEIRRTGSGVYVAGQGAGHGVGLCEIGAARLAAGGASARAILSQYFPGLAIGTVADADRSTPTNILVSLPDADQTERTAVRDLARRALAQLATTLGVSPPATITLRFHPTVESYQRETGRPWFTAAVTQGGEVQLLPVAVLRSRGLLERTIRHEIVHVLTEPVLSGRPRWVAEGAALYFAGEVGSGVSNTSCPTDREMGSFSQDELRAAYTRAGGCFARKVQARTSWRDVR